VRTGFARRWHTLPGPVRVCAALVPPAAVLFLAGGPAAIFVPALYLAYRWRSRWAPGIALIAMAAAGLASAATAQPNAFGAGPFGPAAQLLALLALAAALTPSAPGGS
jgi:arabinofuranan 3-O-arabinosyltransferase